MLEKWFIGNFKSISNRTELDIAPLTLLVGPNSSGKSTIIQSILLLAQTLSSRRTEPQLLLNGEFVRLGTFDDLLHVGQESDGTQAKKKRQLELGFELGIMDSETTLPLATDYRPTKINVEITFENRYIRRPYREERRPAVSRFDLKMEFVAVEEEVEQTSTCSLRITKRRATTDIPASLSRREEFNKEEMLFRPYMYGNYIVARDGKQFRRTVRISPSSPQYLGRPRRQAVNLVAIGADFYHFLPRRLVAYYNNQEIRLRDSIEQFPRFLRMPQRDVPDTEAIQSEFADFISRHLGETDRFRFSPTEFGKWLSTLKLDDRRKLLFAVADLGETWLQNRLAESEPEFNIVRTPPPEPLDSALDLITEFFTRNIRYLGPLREEPRAVYALPPSGDPSDIGLKGEYTAAVLDVNKRTQVSYWNPSLRSIVKGTLNEAVDCWLLHFSLADSVQTKEAGKLGHILTLEESHIPRRLDLTNVGVGVSQVLPILVMGLLAKEGSTLIYEQPEIHLHPKLQADIADFFIGLIYCKKRCIVETHSEYLLSRIRRRLAEADDRDLIAKVRVLFSEKVNSASNFREISINKYGAVIDWPRGFFDQAQLEAQMIIEASMRKQHEQRIE